MISSVAEWFWVSCYFNSISTVFEAAFSYFSIMALLWNFRDFQVFVLGYRAQNENLEITENLYFWVYKAQMNVDLIFDHYFNFLSVKTEINKTNIQKKQTQFNKSTVVRISWNIWPMISKVAESFWEWCHLNNNSRVFEITFSYFSILGFLINFRDFRGFAFGYRAQNENPEITENLYLWVCKIQIHRHLFCDHYFNFWVLKLK